MQTGIPPRQPDLLAAAFLRHADAIVAWKHWSGSVDWDGHLDHTSFMLLPLVYRNLTALGIADPLFPRFKGIIRQAWLANQHWIAEMEPTLAACARAGIEVLVLPPTQRLLHERSAVLDRKQPLSWAVRPEQAEPAIRCLLEAGWRSREVRLPRRSMAGYTLGTGHLLMQYGQDQPLLLTWGLHWWFGERLDAVWRRTPVQQLGRQPVRTLDPADALAFELRRPGKTPGFQRVAELLLSVGEDPPDWQRVGDALRQCPPVMDWSAALLLMQPYFDQWGAPSELPDWCAMAPTPPPRPRASRLERARTDWATYRTALGEHPGLMGRLAPITQLPGYLMGRWRLRGIGGVPTHLLRWFGPNFRSS